MQWKVKFHDEFKREFDQLAQEVRNELLAEAKYIERSGPQTARPHVDTLKGSAHANMKELRFEAADGEWRAAFAFDPQREAVVLVAADKTGVSEKQFYKALIAKADVRYARHIDKLELAAKAAEAAKKPEKNRGRDR